MELNKNKKGKLAGKASKGTLPPTALLAKWRGRKKKALVGIPRRPEEAETVPSRGQERLWIMQALHPQSPFYQYGHLYKIRGKLDLELLEKSFQHLLQRQELLRSNFEKEDGRLKLILREESVLRIEKFEISDLQATQKKQQALQLAQKQATQIFDLANDPLLRISSIQLGPEEHWLVLAMHHIIGDRLSLLQLNQELFSIYQSLKNQTAIALAPPAIQYADYAAWQHQQSIPEEQVQYWLKQLAGELPVLNWPSHRPSTTASPFAGAQLAKKLSPQLSVRLQQLAQRQECTPYTTLLTAFKVLLFRYTQQEDMFVGSPYSNRDQVALEKLLGFFNETLVLRSQLSGKLSFLDLLEQVKATSLEALANKTVPFEELVRRLQPERRGNSNPIFQTMFLYNAAADDSYAGLDLNIEEESLDLGVSKFDLTLFVNERTDYLELVLEFALDCFSDATAQQMLDHLAILLQSIVANPAQSIAELPMLSPSESQKMLVDWNPPPKADVPYIAIHQLIETMAKQHPEETAVVYEGASISYRELEEQANALAHYLLSAGVSTEAPVGLYLRRGVPMVVGIIGILKAGAAYLPLDPDYPEDRISYMLADSKASFVLTTPALAETTHFATPILLIEASQAKNSIPQEPLPKVEAEQLAYIIYTSGSTGKPKGVPISHQNLIHSTTARFSFYPAAPKCFLLLSSFSFDSSVVGIFWTLCTGGTLLLPRKRIEQDTQALSSLIEKHQVSHTLLLPSLYHSILKHSSSQQLQSLRNVMVAGEACSPQVAALHFACLPQTELYNEYGPTEASVWCIAHKITAADRHFIPIGKAIPNTQVYLLSEAQQLVPQGVIGELYIGGPGLSKGYLHRPALSAEKFIPHPFVKQTGRRLYRTGDLARFDTAGCLEYLGRVDQQVKIRGYRVEPGEVEKFIGEYEAVQEALVVVKGEQLNKKLVAYMAGIKPSQIEALNHFLQERLPPHMIPAVLIPLDQFPRLPNGKINRKELPAPADIQQQGRKTPTAPQTPTEKTLLDIWVNVLQIPAIGMADNFFSLGGDSLRSIEVIALARQAGLALQPQQLFAHQTIRTLAQAIEKADQKMETEPAALVALNKMGDRPPLFCIHSGGGQVFFYQALAEQLQNKQPVYALQANSLNEAAALPESIEAMAAAYLAEMRKVQAHGPYHLLGTCFSNAVVLEMAHQLTKAGESIGLLLIVDSAPVHLFGEKSNGKKQTWNRFWDLVKRGDYRRVGRKLNGRLFPGRRKQLDLQVADQESDTQLRATIQQLNKLYADYHWQPYAGKIHFIRSREFSERKDKQYHLTQWRQLALGGLEVHVVDGHHLHLFEQPEVVGLSEKIEAITPVVSLGERG